LRPGRPTPPAPAASEQEAREVAEAAREKDWQAPSFVRELFEGSFRLDLVHPFPVPDPADLERARPLMERLERFMRERVDSDRIDREGKIPEDVVRGLGEIGAFGLKIPTEYGGLGLSQYSYTHAIGLVQPGWQSRRCCPPRSRSVPNRSRHRHAEQKQRHCLARGVSAFALTEPRWVRPAGLTTTRALRGRHYSSTARSSGAPTAPSPSSWS
jgi:alkylation response protein AidB-like acyl-CoA dehydrogenase